MIHYEGLQIEPKYSQILLHKDNHMACGTGTSIHTYNSKEKG